VNRTMRRKPAGILALLLAIPMACTTEPSESVIRKKAGSVTLLLPETRSADLDRKYEFVSRVKSASCGRQQVSEPSLEEAQKMLKMEAAKVGADAVMNISCEDTGVHFSYNCGHAIKCRGDAVKGGENKHRKKLESTIP